MRKRFPSSQIICLGNKLEEMDDDVCYIEYENSFGIKDKYREYWQPTMINWNGEEVNFDVF